MDAIVAKGRSGELEVTEVAGEYLSGHRHHEVDQVDDDGGSSQEEEELELDPRGSSDTPAERDAGVGEYSFEFAVGFEFEGRRRRMN